VCVRLRKPGAARTQSAGAYGGGEVAQDGGGGVDVHACVRDALAVGERGRVTGLLAALDQEALQHDADDAALPRRDLLAERGGDHGLAAVVLAAVAVARVDHEPARQASRLDQPQRVRHLRL
jgi:hypothetical protein